MEEKIEEILEKIWMLMEDERNIRDELTEQDIQELVESGLLEEKNGTITLTTSGHEEARRMVRNHRLAERLFHDVLEIKGESLHGHACIMEHAIAKEVEEAICTLLGHPRVCPHGRAIPPGDCCRLHRKVIERIVLTLKEMENGERGRVSYILTKKFPRMHKLMSLGLVPGAELELIQKKPTFVIKLEETQIAIDDEVAGNIYVRKVPE